MDHGGPRKRQRMSKEEEPEIVSNSQQQEPQKQEAQGIEHVLYVRWHGSHGQTKLNMLKLRQLDTIDDLKDLPNELIQSHYPSSRQLPDYFTNTAYVRFTPQVECLALPGDVVRTEMRLAVCYKGWEYTILKRDTSRSEQEAEQTLQFMTAEFMGSDPLMAALGLRISLIAYPVVALKKVFLQNAHEKLLASPETFKGML